MHVVTLADVARELRLSISTVSRALNPAAASLISEPVRLKIQQTAAKMGYVANHTAQQLVLGRSYTLGVVIATAFNSLFFRDQLATVMEGLYSVLQVQKRYGCKLVLLPREKHLTEMDRYMLSSQVDGLLISTQCDFSVNELYQLAEQLQLRSKRPVVAINLPVRKNSPISVVTFSNREAAFLGVMHLLKQGRRHIGLVYADNNAEDARERVEGYKKALVKEGVLLRQELIAQGDFSTASGYRAAGEILKRVKRCDALFCINDEMAIGAMAAVREAGYECPNDIAVMGFDGLALGEFTHPRLSTVCQPTLQMASAAAQLLIDRIERKRQIKSPVVVPAQLALRDSA